MQDNQGKTASIPRVDGGPVAERLSARHVKRTSRARYLPAVLISMIVVPMLVILGFYAAVPARAAGPSTVDLLSAGSFVILSESGISSTGTTHIWGDIGVSPIDSTAISGNFALTLDSLGTFSTSPLVTGNVYAADYASPTPSMLITARSDMLNAYNDSADRTSPDFVDLHAGDVTGQILAPGLYNYTTGLLISAGGVTISGAAGDHWIFQIAGDLTVDNDAHVTLVGAVASNIFWQVAGQTTIGTTAAMKGIILCKTAITMATGATLEGRALAQTAVTLDANYVYEPGVVIPEFSQVLIPMVGMLFVVAIVGKVRNQKK